MKKVFAVLVAILLCSVLAMCIGQKTLPESFIQEYQKIETTQKEIEITYKAYEDQVNERVEYIQKNNTLDEFNNSNIDHDYVLSLLESELLIIDELDQKSSIYSSQINELFAKTKDIENNEVKSKSNELVIILRNSQQYLTNGVARLRTATKVTGSVLYYYATDANLSDSKIKTEIENLNLESKTGFDEAVLALNNYYTLSLDANSTYQELKKLK